MRRRYLELVEYLFNYFNFALIEEKSEEYKLRKILLRDGFFIAALKILEAFKNFDDFEFSTHTSFYLKHLLSTREENPQFINVFRTLYKDFNAKENKLFYSHISKYPEIENEVKKWDLHNDLQSKLEKKYQTKKLKI